MKHMVICRPQDKRSGCPSAAGADAFHHGSTFQPQWPMMSAHGCGSDTTRITPPVGSAATVPWPASSRSPARPASPRPSAIANRARPASASDDRTELGVGGDRSQRRLHYDSPRLQRHGCVVLPRGPCPFRTSRRYDHRRWAISMSSTTTPWPIPPRPAQAVNRIRGALMAPQSEGMRLDSAWASVTPC